MSRKQAHPKVPLNRDLVEKIHKEICSTSIPEEMHTLYLLANSVQILTETIFRRIEHVFLENNIHPKSNDLLDSIEDYCRMIRKACRKFYDSIEPQICGATFNYGRTAKEKAALYDSFNAMSNELIRLLMLYRDRTNKNDKYLDIFEYLYNLESTGLFTLEDILKYKIQTNDAYTTQPDTE